MILAATPVPHTEGEGACIPGPVGEPSARSRDGILVQGTPLLDRPPLAAKPPTGSILLVVSNGVLHAREGNLPPNNRVHGSPRAIVNGTFTHPHTQAQKAECCEPTSGTPRKTKTVCVLPVTTEHAH